MRSIKCSKQGKIASDHMINEKWSVARLTIEINVGLICHHVDIKKGLYMFMLGYIS